MQLESIAIALDDVCNPAAVCYLSPSVVKACNLWEAVLISWPHPSTLRDLRGKPGGTASVSFRKSFEGGRNRSAWGRHE